MVTKRVHRFLIIMIIMIGCVSILEVKGMTLGDGESKNIITSADTIFQGKEFIKTTIGQKQEPIIRNLNEQLVQKSIEDISQKEIPQLQQRKLVVTKQRAIGRVFTQMDAYNLWISVLLAEDINGKVIYEINQTKTIDGEQNSSHDIGNIQALGQFKFLTSNKVNGIDVDKLWARQLIKIEKQLYQNLETRLTTQIETSKELLKKYTKIQNESIQLQNDGYSVADSKLPPIPKNNTVEHLPFCIVVPSYNNAQNLNNPYKRNINSILQQEYTNYHVVYIDDNSDDETTLHVINYLKGLFNSSYEELTSDDLGKLQNVKQNKDKQKTMNFKFNNVNWTFIKNQQKKYALQNIYQGIHQHCQENSIVVILDGDDSLVGTQVLPALNQIYKLTRNLFIYSNYAYKIQTKLSRSFTLPQEWATVQKLLQERHPIVKQYEHQWVDKSQSYKVSFVRSYEKGPAGTQVPIQAIKQKKFREKQYLLASHLLTFYVPLFKKIDKSNFLDQNNKFLKYGYDRALTLPLAEMVPTKTLHLKEIMYEYSANTGINDSPENWANASLKIRQKPPVQQLTATEIQELLNRVLMYESTIRTSKEQLVQKNIEDIAQKEVTQLEQRELVVIEQKKKISKLSESDTYNLWMSVWLAEDVNGNVIYQKNKTNVNTQENNLRENQDIQVFSQFRFLTNGSSKVDGINVENLRVKQLINKEKQLYENLQRRLKTQIQTSKEVLTKNTQISNEPEVIFKQSKTQNSQKLIAKQSTTQIEPTQIKNEGNSQIIPSNPENNTVEYLPFCIVVPSYNNAKNPLYPYKRNINSILQQEYTNYHVVYIDDNSDDETTLHVINYLKDLFNSSYEELKSTDFDNVQILGQNKDKETTMNFKFNGVKWNFIKNNKKKCALQNIYQGIHQHCQENSIVVILDGDDSLVGTQVLPALNQIYKLTRNLFIYSNYAYKIQTKLSRSFTLPQEWATVQKLLQERHPIVKQYEHQWVDKSQSYKVNHVRSYQKGPAGKEVPLNAIRQKKFREQQSLLASHLLTFYVPLFKKIDKSDFLDQNNKFLKYGYDKALTVTLAELAPTRILYVKEIMYEYSSANTGINESPENWFNSSFKMMQKPPLEQLKDSEIEELLNSVLTH